jgi:hypothetical protein
MTDVTLEHFKRAILDISANGDNDTLPFDIDSRFITENKDELASIAFSFSERLEKGSKESARDLIEELPIFSERLLVPTGTAGFRITTKIHPFWNIYFNALGVSVAEALEPIRSPRAHSYRFAPSGKGLFNRDASWRAFREASIADCESLSEKSVVVQTDISSFYEHVSHHRVENLASDLFAPASTVSTQIDRFLSRFASGRSFDRPQRCRNEPSAKTC